MKSGLASALTAFAEVAKLQKENAEDIEKLPGTLVFIGTVDEEADMKGSEAVVQQGWIQKEDWVLDMEPTSGMIQMAHKGRTWFELSVEGITAHASMPEKGADAIAGNCLISQPSLSAVTGMTYIPLSGSSIGIWMHILFSISNA